MNQAQLLDLAMRYGRQYGPRALEAWRTLTSLVDKNPQLGKLSDKLGSRLTARRPGSKLHRQIELAKEFATIALTDQTVPERQELARSWTRTAKALDMQLRAADGGPSKLAKGRRADVAERVDLLLTEIIETTMKWAES
ncbi:MAG TPA: hypothetical protein VF612_05815 [Jatrophihabitans sp.]|jgi:hypothetical protein|uniref:hypothetical protein n=1 Tax=Jatrophihabitans sp. TaxID=1932789 RepID=UPI002EF78816